MNAAVGPFSGQSDRVTGDGGVLVVGLSHSGKTEVRSLLETSPRMFGARRSAYWAISDDRWGPLDVEENLESCLNVLERDVQLAGWLIDVRESVGTWVAATNEPTYSTMLACLHQSEALRRGKDMWCVQVGGVEPLLPRRLEALPELKVVHMVRDPRDRLALSRPSPLPGRRGWDLGRWESSVRIGLECHNRFPDRYMLATWEDLMSRPAALAAELAAFVGCRLDPTSVGRAGTEKSSPRGGINGPHTVGAVQGSMTAMGYRVDPTRVLSPPDLVELATLNLYRWRYGAVRLPAVPR